jgi:hypothetical protein
MSIIREQIRYIGNTTNIKFNLDVDNSLLGFQQEIDNLTQTTSIDLVNPPVDIEERRYKNDYTSNNITFRFTLNGMSYGYNYENAGFSTSDILNDSLNKQNSFYILDFYDSYDVNNQTKILTSYLTKIGDDARFVIDSNNQIYYWYVPISYINSQLDLGITRMTGYTKFSFFNASAKNNNNLILFYNIIYENNTTPQRMYFTTELDFIKKTWKFINPNTNLTANQLWNSQDYIKKVNKSYTSYDNEQQNYPNGSEFDANTGKYV